MLNLDRTALFDQLAIAMVSLVCVGDIKVIIDSDELSSDDKECIVECFELVKGMDPIKELHYLMRRNKPLAASIAKHVIRKYNLNTF